MIAYNKLDVSSRRIYVDAVKRQLRYERRRGALLYDSPIEVKDFAARSLGIDIPLDIAREVYEYLEIGGG